MALSFAQIRENEVKNHEEAIIEAKKEVFKKQDEDKSLVDEYNEA